MFCNVAIEYSKPMNTFDFREEVTVPTCIKAARQIVHDILYEEEYHDEDCASPELHYKFDNDIVTRNDPYEKVALVPRAKKLIQKALVEELKDSLIKYISFYVSPFSPAEMDEGVPGDVAHSTPVKLRATNDDELLQFLFSADLNLSDEQLPMDWHNIKIEINYVKRPKKD